VTASAAPPSAVASPITDLSAADADCRVGGPDTLTPLVRDVIRRLRAAHRHLIESKEQATAVGAVEWLLDNWFVISEALRQIEDDLPPHFVGELPGRLTAPDRGVPRAWRLARLITRTSGNFLDLSHAAVATEEYQQRTALTIGELWALPGLFRLAVLDDLTTCAERLAGIARAEAGGAPETPGALETRVAGGVTSLRRIAVHDWKSFVEGLSRLEALLREDPAGAHARSEFAARDRYRKAAEEIARSAGTDERTVAAKALALSRASAQGDRAHHVGFFLVDAGRPELERQLGCAIPWRVRARRWLVRHASSVYLGGVALLTAALVLPPVAYLAQVDASLIAAAAAVLVASVPAVGIAVPAVNWIVTQLLPPRPLPRLDFEQGIPPECRTVVAVPTLLTSRADVEAMLRQLEVNHQGNADPEIRFALLTDGPDADTPELPEDELLLAAVATGVEDLNRRYARDGGGPFLLLHRKRSWNEAEGRWMGWERKRGKLAELNHLLLGDETTDLTVVAGRPEALEQVRFVITLDADTELPGGTAARMIGTLAHPLNAARFDETGQIRAGYTVLQPRLEVSSRSAGDTPFARIFEGDTGLDLYTHAVSDAYHDLFGEGIYAGKGIYDVAAFERSLAGRVPDNALLSHDLFEGIHGRAGFLSDVQLLEDYPSHVIGYARRLHRWVRGDWQLLPWLAPRVPTATGGRERTPLSLIDRWKIADNLRRSLTAPFVLALLLLGWLWLPGSPWVWTGIAAGTLAVPIVLGAATTANRLVTGAAWRPTVAWAVHGAGTDALRWVLALLFLAFEAVVVADALSRTLARLFVTRRHLLEWQSAALTARAVARTRSAAFMWRQMASSPAVAVGGGVLVVVTAPGSLPAACPFLAAWLVAPGVAHLLSQPRGRAVAIPTQVERARLRRLARRTWHYFERVLSPNHSWLAPDHLQEAPVAAVAHRTSPTNVGMGLLATLAAYDLGYLGLRSTATVLANTMRGLAGLERFRGHFFNWYDTRSSEVLPPRYVSVVDSGNLAAALITVRHGCADLEHQPVVTRALWRGLRDTLDVLDESAAALELNKHATDALREAVAALRDRLDAPPDSPAAQRALLGEIQARHVPALEAALAGVVEAAPGVIPPDRLRALRTWLERIRHQTGQALLEFDALAPWAAMLDDAPEPIKAALTRFPTLRDTLILADRLPPASDGPARQEQFTAALERAASSAEEVLAQLRQVGEEAGFLEVDMDFRFLYDSHRRLFHIGYDADAGQLDGSYYDLLASEARLASLVAIAKRDVPERHWLYLGRPFGRVDGKRVLLSWGGTMFEYLMPPLLTELPDQALLTVGCQAAIRRQQSYARQRGVPWGISESAFHHLNPEGHYQYRAFGVPGLGLKRDLGDRLVISPYATVLALPLVPRDVAANVERLEHLGGMGLFGLYEALDFGASEPGAEHQPAIVRAYMSHHQGMILTALANHLAGNKMVRRFHMDARVASVEYLLFEQVPRHVPIYRPERRPVRPPSPRRERYRAWDAYPAATPQLHILSNGRYSTVVTGSGGGGSRWRGRALSRWRAEAGVDQWGHWLYLQDLEDGALWSVGRQPVHDAPVETSVLFSPGGAEYRARGHGIAARAVVTVPPGDDLEVWRVTLTNESRVARRLALTSVFEVALARPADDLRHQAFGKLFVESETLEQSRAIVFRRRPGGPDPHELFLGHALAVPANVQPGLSFETDRARFYGRGGAPQRPAALETPRPLSGTAGATLDPLAALRATVDLAPGEEIPLAFVTAVGGSRDELLARLETSVNWSRIARSFEEASVHAEGELNALAVTPEEARTIQRLFSALIVPDARLRPAADVLTGDRSSQTGLWQFGISGDLPMLVIRAAGDRNEQLDVIRAAMKFHMVLRHRGCENDLVLLDEVSSGYQQPYYERLAALVAEVGGEPVRGRKGGAYLIRARDLSATDRRLIEAAARVVLDTARTLDAQLAALDEAPAPLPAFMPVRGVEVQERHPPGEPERLVFDNGLGGFTSDGREYVLRIGDDNIPPRAWVHVVANPDFGFVISATGGGFTWAANSGERRLTPWRNDPVTDLPGEILYFRDEESGAVWSATPAPAGTAGPYMVRFGAGYAVFSHRAHGIAPSVRMCVAPDAPVKIIEVTLENDTDRLRRLTATYYVEWVLGMSRHRTGPHLVPEYDSDTGALLARNPFHPTFTDRVAFLTASERPHGLTTDRVEFVGETNDLARPAALRRVGPSGTVRPGGDVCGALQVYVQLEPGERRTVHFALGDGANRAEALELVRRYRDPAVVGSAREDSDNRWEELLGAVQVSTPDPALDVMLNRWLKYQATACRLWARTALHQSSGAFGFRDQLQDGLALAPTAPQFARNHLIEAASHQFEDGDVLHWWHPGAEQGVRTHCSDDLLWLPFAATHYASVTGDVAVFDEPVPFLTGEPLGADEGDRFGRFQHGPDPASLYEHCLRALDRGFRLGEHGLPLFGTGDWNDGMNRVGAKGRGESVWLAWFLAATFKAFAPVCERRGDGERAATLRERAAALAAAVEATAWDGNWYVRGFYDDGTPLGSAQSVECRIDAVAQSWAVISGVADPDRARTAMRSVMRELADEELSLVRLFDPPFDSGPQDPGYIKAYPPGVRENGGQYTHAAIWTAWAVGLQGDGDRLGELFGWLNPVNRTSTRAGVERYRGEPYVVAADVSPAPLHAGAAGWTWYTGSAAWLYRLGVEILLGIRREGDHLRVDPCIPRHWEGFDVQWRIDGAEYRVHVRNPERVCRGVRSVTLDGRLLDEARIPLAADARAHDVEVVLGSG
jgi:cyclic beta-1,2-glucan synthetase